MSRIRAATPTILAASTLLLIALTATLPAAWAQNGIPKAGRPAPAPKVPIMLDAGWSSSTTAPPAFFWNGAGVVFASDSFEFDGRACITVTDDFFYGDQFRIYDNGGLLGDTSTPIAAAMAPPVGPDAAYADPNYSSGTFVVQPGSHSITIEVIANPFDTGRGYIRIDTPGTAPYCPDAPTVPGVGLAALLAALLLGGTLAMRRRGAAATIQG